MKFFIKKIIILLVIIIIYNKSYAHFDIFNIKNSTIDTSNILSDNYGLEVSFNSNYTYLEDLGIDFFNVGIDDSAIITLKIYDNDLKKEIFKQTQTIVNVYGQLIYFQINKTFYKDKKYIFQLLNDKKYSCNIDNKIKTVNPNYLPITDNSKNITAFRIFSNDSTGYPLINSSSIPMFHFGIIPQTGIEFMSNGTVVKATKNIYISKINALKTIDTYEIGLKTKRKFSQHLKFEIFNLTDSISEFKIDTNLTSNSFSTIYLPVKIKLKQDNSYFFIYDFKEILDSAVYLINFNLPLIDNLNLIELKELYCNQDYEFKNLKNSNVGLPILINFNEPNNNTLNLYNKSKNDLTIKFHPNKIEVKSIENINTIQIFDLLGCEIKITKELIDNKNAIINHTIDNKIVLLKINNLVQKIDLQ